MFNWFKKKKKPAEMVTHVHDVKEHSSVKVQPVAAEQITDSFNHTTVINYYSEQTQQEIQVLINTHHLPEPTTALIGRQKELVQLNEAFKNPNYRLAIIVAAGGIGKSALTDEWLQHISAENYHGKTRVFGWSFYSQGSHNTFTNSQPFFNAVLPFLGVPELPKDEIEKARLLAQKLREQPCLLILDGLEPLQYSESLAAMSGELQDSALKEFIACLRRDVGQSFALLSSRQPLVELKKWRSENYLALDLKTLPHADGIALLKALEVKGSTTELQAISEDLNGHALSLVLMGHLLQEYHDGDSRYANELPPLTEAHGSSDAEKDSRHALRVLDYYDSLQDEASRCFLQLLGLFDRPMNVDEKRVLIERAQHAAPLRALTEAEWKKVEQRLEKGGLLLGKKGSFERLEWDTHPIIRDYFGRKFKENYPEAFKQAHSVLFEYFQKLPEKEFPDTWDEMKPLYLAVKHGCLAGEYYKADFDIYWKRIRRGNEGYSIHKLGLYSEDLVALSAFFSSGWHELIATGLNEENQAWLLSTTSFCLMSLGYLSEAGMTRLASLNLCEKQKNWENASRAAQTLVDVYLPLGQLLLAHNTAQQAFDYAQSIDDRVRQLECQCYLAAVHYHYGRFKESFKCFQQAERLEQKELNQYLTSGYGFDYCQLLLASAQDGAVLHRIITRAEYDLKVVKNLLSMALDYLTLARVHAVLNEFVKADSYFQKAIQGIQKANRIDLTPSFYLGRADFYLSQNQLDPALADLNSAWDIIERCGMKLYAVDYLLIHGRYCLALNDTDTALNHYTEAKALIEETGYHLRDAELDLFAAQICQTTNASLHSKTAEDYLQNSKTRIEEIGQWGLMPRWKLVAQAIH